MIRTNLEFSNFSKSYDLETYLNNSKYIILVVDEDLIKAFMIVLHNIDYYELEMIIVSKMYRALGLGKKLMSYFIDNYLNFGDRVLLEVATKNNIAINLYQSYDFKIIHKRNNYYQDDDAYVMEMIKK